MILTKKEMTFVIVTACLLISAVLYNCVAEAATLIWTPATHRVDNSLYSAEDQAGYKIHFGEIQGGPYDKSISINDKAITSYDLTFPVNNYAVVTSIDSGGRESVYSTEVLVKGEPAKPVMRPAQIDNVFVEQVDGKYRYNVTWDLPATYEDGVTPLDYDDIIKLYLFVDNVWQNPDVQKDEQSRDITLELGEHVIEMEVEIRTKDGGMTVGDRSEPVIFLVTDRDITSPPSPPNPPTKFIYIVPNGFKAIEITVVPVDDNALPVK